MVLIVTYETNNVFYLAIHFFKQILPQHTLCFLQNLESLEAQLADALSDRNKATETISSLQVRIFLDVIPF